MSTKPAPCGECRPHEPHRTTVAIGDGGPAGYAIADCPGIPAPVVAMECPHGKIIVPPPAPTPHDALADHDALAGCETWPTDYARFDAEFVAANKRSPTGHEIWDAAYRLLRGGVEDAKARDLAKRIGAALCAAEPKRDALADADAIAETCDTKADAYRIGFGNGYAAALRSTPTDDAEAKS